MTTYNKNTLKTFFETNDVPQGSDYANLIDSQINIVETASQAMAGALQTPELAAARVSAGNGNFTGTMTIAGQASAKANFKAKSITVSALAVTSNVSANKGYFNSDVSVSGNATVTGNVNTATVSATNFYMQAGTFSATVNIAASGTTLGGANLLTTSRITILTAATDGTATGVGLLSNKAGLVQYIYNDTAVSANLWPCTGGQINNLASGAAFGMTAKTPYTIIHTKASGYAVK